MLPGMNQDRLGQVAGGPCLGANLERNANLIPLCCASRVARCAEKNHCWWVLFFSFQMEVCPGVCVLLTRHGPLKGKRTYGLCPTFLG